MLRRPETSATDNPNLRVLTHPLIFCSQKKLLQFSHLMQIFSYLHGVKRSTLANLVA